MNRVTYATIAGKKYPLIFSLAAVKAIGARFGCVEKMADAMSTENGATAETFNNISFILAVLIKQGVAYMNMFASDLPPEPESRYENGKYIALSQEEIEIAVDINDAESVIGKIGECIDKSSKTKIEIQAKEKNEEAPEITE